MANEQPRGGRRGFLGALAGIIAAAPAVVSTSEPPPAISFNQPACRNCFCMFDITQHRREDESVDARNARLLSPIPITCQYCGHEQSVTFLRRT